MTTGVGLPGGATVKAGPWFSNEELKLVVILDVPDHSLTFPAFVRATTSGMIEKRRFYPIVDWKDVEAYINHG